MTQRYEKSPVFRPGFLNGAQSIGQATPCWGPHENLLRKFSWGSEERRRDEKSPGPSTGAFARTEVRDELELVDGFEPPTC